MPSTRPRTDRETTTHVIDVTDEHLASRPSRTAAFGLGVAAAGPVLIIVADPAAAPFVAPFAVVPAIGAFLAYRFGRWAQVIAALLGAFLLLSVVASPAGEGLRYFASFFDFVPSVMFGIGGAIALVGGIGGLRPGPVDRRLPVAPITLGALGVIALASGIASVATNETVDAAAAADATVVTMTNEGFGQDDYTVPTGTSTLLIRNDSAVVHTLTNDALGVDETLLPGDERLVEVTVPSGSLVFWCTPHSEVTDDGNREGMVSRLTAS